MITYKDELYHHGIKGQKWGRRRFQKRNGSLTPAGKLRYLTGDEGKAPFTNTPSAVKKTTLGEYKNNSSGKSQYNSSNPVKTANIGVGAARKVNSGKNFISRYNDNRKLGKVIKDVNDETVQKTNVTKSNDAKQEERWRKMTEYGKRQIERIESEAERKAERHIKQNQDTKNLQERMLKENRATTSSEEIKLVQDDGKEYRMGIDRTGRPYFIDENGQRMPRYREDALIRRYGLISDPRALSAKKANYAAKTGGKPKESTKTEKVARKPSTSGSNKRSQTK